MDNMKPVLIVEHMNQGLKLNESESKTKNKYLMEGVFTVFNVKNRNDRIYTAEKFLPHLDELLERRKATGVIYGEYDHPDVFDTSLSRVSHVVENAWFNEDDNRVDGQIILLDTHWGKEAKAIVNEGYPVFVSSRAAGVTDSAGTVELKKLFTYDCVADPGFAEARMSLKSINESVGYDDDASFRVYEAPDNIIKKYSKIFDLSNESKTNELFEMNKDDLVTKQQLSDYSDYLVEEINRTKLALEKVSTGTQNFDPESINNLSQYYEQLNNQNKKVVEYLDYLSKHIQVVVDDNKKLRAETKEISEKTNQLIEHQDYLAENLEKSINYQNYLAENLDKSIAYSEYVAENVDKNIEYSNYLAENLDKNISYAEYLAENLDKNISYSEYIAENLNANIKYSEYLAENLDANVAYSEYIAENVEKGIKYSEYVAECTDKTMSYAGTIAESLNGDALNEGASVKSPAEYLAGEMSTVSEDAPEVKQDVKTAQVKGDSLKGGSVEATPKTHAENAKKEDTPKEADESKPSNSDPKHLKGDMEKETAEGEIEKAHKSSGDKEPSHVAENAADKYLKGDMDSAKKEGEIEKKHKVNGKKEPSTVAENAEVEKIDEKNVFKPGELTNKIDALITEAKKREASKVSEPHFYKFLNRSQIKAFESLTQEDQENVTVAMNESKYYSTKDVLTIMRESLTTTKDSPEEKLLNAMPQDLHPVWESLNENQKNSVIAQSKFYVLDSDQTYEHFWATRKLGVRSLNESKNLIQHDELKMNDNLSESYINGFKDRFKNLN